MERSKKLDIKWNPSFTLFGRTFRKGTGEDFTILFYKI